jgi:hypothetical protein
MSTYKCQSCGDDFTAREADRKRGWARFCSKSCKAIKQESRTGQYKAFKQRCEVGAHDADMDGAEGAGWDAHKDWL